jgi:alanine-glyoxylate transaminase / (R)-3-amino-2-methylpropionate-pyruvate transaminase
MLMNKMLMNKMLMNKMLIRGVSKYINKNNININRYLSNITGTEFRNSVIHNRDKYLSPSLATFQAYDDPLVLTRGKMQYVWDSDDKKYIDLLGQNLCISVGHCHPKVTEKAIEQMNEMPHCTTMYYHEKPALLGKKLVEKMPPHPSGEDWVVHLLNDGSEAVDLAAQMARVYTGRSELYALNKSYHGLHGYAAGLTAIGKATQPCYNSMFSSINHIPANNLEVLENHIQFATCGKVAGIIMEPLQGYGGIFPLDKGYMKDAFSLIKQHGGVTIADEVQTGFNRCGETFWGFEMEHNDAIPDIVTIAKGMGNGIGIIGAVICRRSIAEAFSTKMFFNTYGSNPVAASAALGVLEVMEEDNILENCSKQGEHFTTKINELIEKYPSVYKEIRGSGLFQGLEIYGKTEQESCENAIELHRRTLQHGVLIGRGSAAGNVFRLQPPMCIETHDVDRVVEVLEIVGDERVQELN